MKRWRKTIDIKEILHRDQTNTDPAYVASVGKEIASLIRSRTSDGERDFSVGEALDIMDDIDVDEDDAVDEFNCALSEIYNWADRERVWLGI